MSARDDPLFNLYFWKKIAFALAINALTVSAAITLFFLSGLVDEPFPKVMATFKNSHYYYFWPLNQLPDFFRSSAVESVFVEELFARGPVRILSGLILLFRREKNRRFVLLVWSVGLILNFQWAATHTIHKLVWIPVFAAGLPWLWLTIKTSRLWPAMFCHIAANLSIYFLIKVYQLLY